MACDQGTIILTLSKENYYMCRKLIYLISLVLLLGLAADRANADITTDLMGYWKLDDNANDSSGNNYHGEEFGNPSYVPGMIGQAMEFNGSQSVYIPEFTGIQNQDEVTVCMWVKADRNTGVDQVMWFTNEDGGYGRVRFGINGDEWEWKHGDGIGNPNADDGENPIILGEWTHLAGIRKNNDRLELFVNGISVERTAFGIAGVARAQGSIGSERRSPTSVRDAFEGTIDEVRIYRRALSAADIQELFAFTGAPRAVASNPDPTDEATDVPRDVVIGWTPGEYVPPINGHTVYLSESFNDVNDGIGGVTQDASSYAPPQRLDFDKTYYWRADEINAPPDSTVYRGSVWSFTTEPVAYPIENITATASSKNSANEGPEKTIYGSGLDADDLHSAENVDMWLSNITGPQPTWIQYEFGRIYKLHQMRVWNHNSLFEQAFGLGVKDANIEHSVDGTNWTTLGTNHEFTRASGAAGYADNTTVDFGDVVAKYVKITANSNWGGIVTQYGISEVRFLFIPVQAREPNPVSGSTDMDVDNVTLVWRAGREAADHDVYLSINEQAVIDETISPVRVPAGSSFANYDTGALDLNQTYYWKVNEVNEAETPSTWESNIWSFTTTDHLIVDDFEDYDIGNNEIWWTWIDGLGYASHPTKPPYPGNGTGSMVGDETTLSYMEETIVHGGNQSMPVFYDNSILRYSEVEMTLTYPRDWTENGVSTLSIWFRGISDNAAETLYVVLNGSAVVTNDNPDAALVEDWTQWNIDLQVFGVNLANVNTIGLGLGNRNNPQAGGSGTVYFDDLQAGLRASTIVPPWNSFGPGYRRTPLRSGGTAGMRSNVSSVGGRS